VTYLNHIETSLDDPEAYLTGIDSMVTFQNSAGAWLYTSTGEDGGITVWNVNDLSVVEWIGIESSTGLAAASQLDIVELNGQSALLSFGQNGQTMTGYWINSDGSLSNPFTLSTGADALVELEVVNLADRQLFFTSSRQGTGVDCWERGADGNLQLMENIEVGSDQTGNDIAGLVVVTLGGEPHLLVLSSFDNSLSTLRIESDGSTTLVSTVSSANTLSISNPTDLEVVTVDGQSYALITAAGSNSISVVALDENGSMRVVDQVNDTLDTRFQSATIIETVTVQGQVFVLVSGTDDGLTLMTLLPGGRLLHLETIADSMQTGLTDITTLSMSVVGNDIEIFTSGEGLTGLGHFRVAIEGLGAVEIAAASGEILNGTSGADQLTGNEGDDNLYGHNGDDILVDGAGLDHMYGGDGADVFVLVADGQTDVIEDFDIDVDRIDLSAWGRVSTLDVLDFNSTNNGVEISFGNETVIIISADGSSLTQSDFSISGLFDAWHVPVSPVVLGDQIITGTHQADTIRGTQGNDKITGLGGADHLIGEDGDDFLNGGTPNAGFDSVGGQVFRLYRATLDRTPDMAGHSSWTNRIIDASLTLQEVAEGFVNSSEFQIAYGSSTNTEFVTLLYQNVLGRAADTAGLNSWVGKLESGELSRAQVVLGFSQSGEFITETAGACLEFSLSGHQMRWADDVYRLYHATLDRDPDAGGFNSWTVALGEGRALESVAAGFVSSSEFTSTYGSTTNTEFVTLLYQNVLDREPDSGGLTNWVDRLEGGELSRAQVVLGFSQSQEFINSSASGLVTYMRSLNSGDVLEGGAGDDDLFGGVGADRFVFNSDDAGSDQVIGLESWDWIDLRNFDYDDADAAMAQMVQDGANVVFSDGAVEITFLNTQLGDITEDMLLV